MLTYADVCRREGGARQELVVLDCLAWKGYDLYDCSFEFRRLWLCGKLAEIAGLEVGGVLRRSCLF
jgi:hypothetical protein